MTIAYAALMICCAYLAERQTEGIVFAIGDGGGTIYPFKPNDPYFGTLFVVIWLGIIALVIAASCAWVKLPAFTVVGIMGLVAVLPYALLWLPQVILGKQLWHESPTMATMYLLTPVFEVAAGWVSLLRLRGPGKEANLSILADR